MKTLNLKTVRHYFGKVVFICCLFFVSMLTFIACDNIEDVDSDAEQGEIIYVGSNDFRDNQNSVIAYRRTASDSLVQIPGSPFLTGGSGLGNPMQLLGPADTDTPLAITSDGKYLLVVNSGSNTIAVLTINNDGSLTPIAGSPFPSGGQTPVSIDFSGQYVFVVNKSQDPLHPITQNPNYNTFTIASNGALTPVANAKVETNAGSSPSQILVSNNQKFAFGTDFLGFQLTPPKGTLRSFTIGSSGILTPVAGTPYTIPGMGGSLGLWQHPRDSALYVGFPMQNKVGIYSINGTTGALTFRSTFDAATIVCWIRANSTGNNLYVLNSGENSVGFYNSSNAFAPIYLGKLVLKNSGPTYPGPGGMPFTTSQPFHLNLSSDENYLYVVTQHTNPDFNVGNFNYLHVLKVSANGSLTEPSEPTQLPIPSTVRPQGVVISSKNNN